jgi:hypothetical protein
LASNESAKQNNEFSNKVADIEEAEDERIAEALSPSQKKVFFKSNEAATSSSYDINGFKTEKISEHSEEVIDLARRYRSIIENTSEISNEENMRLKYLAASCFLDDAWSRKSVNFHVIRHPNALKARSLHTMSKTRLALVIVLLIHMSLAFFEAPRTWVESCNVPFQGRAQAYIFLVESVCVIFYFLLFLLSGLVNGFTWANIIYSKWKRSKNQDNKRHLDELYEKFPKPKADRSNTIYSMIHAIILIAITTDLILRIIFYGKSSFSGSSSSITYSFSRSLRSFLLILNFRRLRQMFGTILRMLPSTFLLLIALLILVLLYSVIGNQSFFGVYPANFTTDNFDTLPRSFITMVVMLTTENYPDAMWPSFQESQIFALIYFISFLAISGAILAAILGVIFDTYRRWVVSQSYRSFQKERIGLAAAFIMLAECPDTYEGNSCHEFPCAHGQGVLTFQSWKILNLYFSKHGKSSYVRKVFERNLGMLGLPKEAAEKLESVALSDTVNNILLPPFWKIIRSRNLKQKIGSNAFVLGFKNKSKQGAPKAEKRNDNVRSSVFFKTRTVVYENVGIKNAENAERIYFLSIDLLGFFKICDRIRSRLEAPPDKPLLKVKKAFLDLLDSIETRELNDEEAERISSHVKFKNGFLDKIFRRKNRFRYQTLLEAAANHDFPEFVKLFKLVYRKELKNFFAEFNQLTIRHRKHMRRYMQHKVKVFSSEFEEALEAKGDFEVDKLKVNEFQIRFLNDMANPRTSETILSKGRFMYSIYGAVVSFFILQLILGWKSLAFNIVLQILELILIVVFLFEFLLFIAGLRKAVLKRVSFMIESTFTLTAAISHISLFILGYLPGYPPDESNSIDWSYRILRTLTTIPMFRIFFVIFSIIEKKFFPQAVFKKNSKIDGVRALKSNTVGFSNDPLDLTATVAGNALDNTYLDLRTGRLDSLPDQDQRSSLESRNMPSERRGLVQSPDLLRLRLKELEQNEVKEDIKKKLDDDMIDVDQNRQNIMFERILRLKNLFLNLSKVLFLIAVIVFAISYFFAIIGMELFGCLGIENDPVNTSYTHFNDVIGSFFVLIQLMSGNNWHQVMYPVIKRTNLWSGIYFVSFYALVTIIIMSLMAALVVEAFDDIHSENISQQSMQKEGKTAFDLYARFVS